MTDQSAAAVAGTAPAPPARLEPNAIGVAQDTVIGMASSAPAATVGLSLAALAAATAYGSGPILILTAIPMLIIANSYRRLNLWNANCGASFEWVGRAINPYLGFLTGWLMVAAYIIGTVAEVLLLGPSVLAVFGSSSTNTGAYIAIGAAVGLVMLVIAIVGIRITARAQVGMALVEYLILIGLAVAGLVFVLSHHAGTVPITKGWFSLSGINGKGSAVAGFLVAVFVYGGWDGTLYVNEEVKHRRTNPGRAAILAVGLLAIIYTLSQLGFQGVVSPAKLQAASANGTALVYVANVLGGGTWAKAMALSIALSVIATTGTGIVLSARIVYGMASYRVLPEFLANVSRRYATPVAASIVVGLLIVGLSTIYYLATSVQNAFFDVIDVTGLLFSIFYILTALATMVYYRRRVFSSVWDALILGLLPLGAAVFLGWILVKSLQAAARTAPAQVWSLVGIVVAGLLLMLSARFILRSSFFQIRRESDNEGRRAGRRPPPGHAAS
jgi:amino acid transporter